jgi:hypothetical protein
MTGHVAVLVSEYTETSVSGSDVELAMTNLTTAVVSPSVYEEVDSYDDLHYVVEFGHTEESNATVYDVMVVDMSLADGTAEYDIVGAWLEWDVVDGSENVSVEWWEPGDMVSGR